MNRQAPLRKGGVQDELEEERGGGGRVRHEEGRMMSTCGHINIVSFVLWRAARTALPPYPNPPRLRATPPIPKLRNQQI